MFSPSVAIPTRGRASWWWGCFFLLLSLLGAVGPGCASLRHPVISFQVPPYSHQRKEVGLIAVLPFSNYSQWEGANKIWRNALISRLIAHGFQVVEPANIDQTLIDEGDMMEGMVTQEALEVLAYRYGVEKAIVGAVEHFEPSEKERRGGLGSPKREVPHLSISLRMLEAKGGEIIWKARLERKGTDRSWAFGIGELATPDKLAHAMAEELARSLVH